MRLVTAMGPPVPSCIHYTVYRSGLGQGFTLCRTARPKAKGGSGIRCNAYNWRDGSTIAELISPTPRLLWRRGVGKWPDCHVSDALSAAGLAKGCTVGALRQPVAHPPYSSGGGGQASGLECDVVAVVCMSAVY